MLFKKYDVKVVLPKQAITIEWLEEKGTIKTNSGDEAIRYRIKFKDLPLVFPVNVVGDRVVIVPLPEGNPSMSFKSEQNLWYWTKAFSKARETGALKELINGYVLSIKGVV